MQVLWAFKMEEAKVTTKESESIAILEDALLVVKTSTSYQRLYSSRSTAEHMKWCFKHQREDNVLCHASDGAAWKHFDNKYPDFATEP